jgi:tetratricopeptide (TPR) repeat protein/pyruvate-formate lyase-activating enzyme
MSDEENLSQTGNPRFCDIVITNRCLLKCKMCKSWQCGPQSNELTFDEAKKFVQSLSEFVKEPLEINVMGGEPLWKDWCLDLCSFISQKGFKSIISTNAYLIDEDMAKRIADSGLNVLAISLESLNPHTHNYLRGKDDVFSKAMKAIEYLEKYCGPNLSLTILTIIMEKNLDEILELTEWVNKNKAIQNISFLALLETGLVQPRHLWFKSQTYKDLWPQDTAKVHRLIDQLIKLRRSGYKIWNPISQLEAFKEYHVDPDKFMRDTEYQIHDYIIDLDESGNIYLSGDVLGNVRTDDLKQLWFSDKANEIRRKVGIRGPGKRCCVINFICAFPPDDQYEKKDPLQENQQVHVAGFRFLEQKEFGKASEEFNKILQSDPRNEHARHGLGLCYQHEGQLDKAIGEFKRGLETNPQNEHIHSSLGFCYKDSKQLDKAVDEFKKSLDLNSQNQYGHVGLGYCYLEQNQVDKAIAEFQLALKLFPQSEPARQGLGSCYQHKERFEEAVGEFKKVLALNPDNYRAHEGLAYCYEKSQQFDVSIGEFNWLLKIHPNNENYYMGLGCCYEGLRQFDKAVDNFKRAQAIKPNIEGVRHCIASCNQSLRQQRRL